MSADAPGTVPLAEGALIVAGRDAGRRVADITKSRQPRRPAVPKTCLSQRTGWTPCGLTAGHCLGGAWLCDDHWREALADATDQDHAACKQRIAQLEESLDRAYERIGRLTVPQSVVYYVLRLSDGLVKIGTTIHFATRMRQLTKEHGDLAFLAVEPGGDEREDEMHDQFSRLHVTGEWFRPTAGLLRWTEAIRLDPEAAGVTPARALPVPELRILIARRNQGWPAFERRLGIRRPA